MAYRSKFPGGVAWSAVGAAALLALVWPTAAGAAALRYADGTILTTPSSCGTGDECATFHLSADDRVVVYNGGAPHCRPYQLRVVRYHGEQVLFSSEQQTDRTEDTHSDFGTTCGRFRNTVLTLTKGHRLMLVQNADGTLSARAFKEPGQVLISDSAIDYTLKQPKSEALYGVGPERVDGHPTTCYVMEGGSKTTGRWDSPVCDEVRARWYKSHPSPSPSPSTSPAP
jgi:hypothetical protein